MRHEIKLKQKTLSTYEYLMKLPSEQEQEIIKCKHCQKFFVARVYLKKHYQKTHPEKDYYRDFGEEDFHKERQQEPSPEKKKEEEKANQEQLFEKIRGELVTSLKQNFMKIETEIHSIKDKQNFKEIENLIHNQKQQNEEEQKKLQESLQKPAQMLEDLKYKWNEMFYQQSSNMKEMIQSSVNDALFKRKEDRRQKKPSLNNSEGGFNSDGGNKDQRIQFYKEKFDQFEEKFKMNEKEKHDIIKEKQDL